ncbi:MAG: hypothetical protein ACLQIB_09445 [Isosphaeraceae bacterium]
MSASLTSNRGRPATAGPARLRAGRTLNFAEPLRPLAAHHPPGRRARAGWPARGQLDDHCRAFGAVMGMALSGDRPAVGATIQVFTAHCNRNTR